VKVGDFVKEAPGSYGVVLACGPVAFDIVWTGGSTTRYRHDTQRHITVITGDALSECDRRHLLTAAAAKAERARGARIRRGSIWTSR